MSVEHWGKPKTVNKEALRVKAEVGFIPANTVEDASAQSARENTIGVSDQHSREELTSALGMILNRIGIPEAVLDEFADDQEMKDKLTVLSGEYLLAVKALDIKKQKEVAEQVRVLLG